MAIAFVQVANNLNTATGQTSLALTISTTKGNLLVALVREGLNSTDAFTVSDSGGNTWNQTSSGYATPTGSSGRTGMFYSKTTAANTSVTANFSTVGGVSNTTIIVIEFSGLVSNPADGSVNSTIVPGTTLTSGTLTTARPNDVLIYGVGVGGNQTTWTQGTGFTIPNNNNATGANGSNNRSAIQYKIVSALFNSTTSMTDNASFSMAGIFAGFSAFDLDEDYSIKQIIQPYDPVVTVF